MDRQEDVFGFGHRTPSSLSSWLFALGSELNIGYRIIIAFASYQLSTISNLGCPTSASITQKETHCEQTNKQNMIRGVLIDLSGTLHVGGKVIPGAVESIQKLRDAGKRIRFLTNTSTKSTSRLWQELLDMGFCDDSRDTMEDILLTSVLATKHYLMKHQLRPFCIMEDVSDFESSSSSSPSSSSGNIDLSPPHNC